MVMCLPMAMLISIPSARRSGCQRRAFAESQSVTVVRAASRTRMITLEGRYFPAPVVSLSIPNKLTRANSPKGGDAKPPV
jgi:hypothetical protein